MARQVKLNRHNPGKYSTAEIELLKDKSLTDYEVAAKIDRSELAVHVKRYRMACARKLVDALGLRRAPKCEHEMQSKFLAGVGDLCSCKKCGFVPYEIGRHGEWIQCHTCSMRSHSQMDVKYKFCGKCNIFHETQNPRVFPGQTQ